jgi:hypothetical protein
VTFHCACALAALVALFAACQSSDKKPPAKEATPSASAPVAASARVIAIEAAASGFVPSTVGAQPGETVVLRFTRTAQSGCLGTVVVPAAAVSRELPLGQAVDVTVTAPASGELAFECGMGMIRGRLVVAGIGNATLGSAAPQSSAAPHSDHAPRHGGVVTMEGDLHVEIVVDANGSVELYLSDAVRMPIPPGEATGTITVEPKDPAGERSVLPLKPDAAKGSLSLRGPALAGKTEYTWDLRVRGQRLRMTLAVPPGGTAAFDTPSGATKGVRRAIGTGQIDVSLGPTGDIVLRLLDGSGKAASARGVRAVVRPVKPPAAEVVLEYDAARDLLRARIPPPTTDHVDATVTVTLADGKPATVGVQFHLEPPRHKAH